MKSGQLTIIVQPEYGTLKWLNLISSFTVPKRFLYYWTFGAVLLVAFGICGNYAIIDNQTIKSRIAGLQLSLEQMKALESSVNSIRKEERIIREFLGIEAWDKNFDINDRMGRGGAEEDDNLVLPPLDIHKQIAQMKPRSLPLHDRVHDLRVDVHELATALSKMTETLNCRPTTMPVKDDEIWITSGFGWRKSPFTGLREFHKGLDISGRKGAKIVATADGVVTKAGYNRFIGNYVRLKHDDRFETGYGHMLKYIVKKGDKVNRGQVLGYMGTTGMSTGYHVHYEVVDNDHKVNPYNFILNRSEITMASTY